MSKRLPNDNIHGVCYLSWIILGIMMMILFPVILIGICKFGRNSSKIPIKLRYPKLTIVTIVYFLLYCLSHSMYYMIQCGTPVNKFYSNFANFMFPPLLLIPVCLLTLRLTLVHYKINVIYDISTISWKQILSKNCLNNKSNKSKVKNKVKQKSKKLFKIFIIYAIFGTAVDVAITYIFIMFGVTHSQIVCAVLLFPLLGWLGYMKSGHVSPVIRDLYYVKWEESWIIFYAGMAFILYGIFHGIMSNIIHKYRNIFDIISITGTDISLLFICTTMTTGLLNKIKRISYTKVMTNTPKLMNNNSVKNFYKEFAFLQTTMSNQDLNAIRESKHMGMTKLLRNLVNSDDGFQLYTEHMFSEYTIESILSFIEFVQWLNLHDEHNDTSEYHYELCGEIPLSFINGNDEFTWFDKIQYLYDKYIKEFCEYQINVPYNIRIEYEHLINAYKTKASNDDIPIDLSRIDEIKEPNNGLYCLDDIKVDDSGFHFNDYSASNNESSTDKCSDAESKYTEGTATTNDTKIHIEITKPKAPKVEPIEPETPSLNTTTDDNNGKVRKRRQSDVNILLKVTEFKLNLSAESISTPSPMKKLSKQNSEESTPKPETVKPNIIGNDTPEMQPTSSLLGIDNAKSKSKNRTPKTLKLSVQESLNLIKTASLRIWKKFSKEDNTDDESSAFKVIKNKTVNKDTFIDIVKETLNILIGLNYQSLDRFTKTIHFQRWYKANYYMFNQNHSVSFLKRFAITK